MKQVRFKKYVERFLNGDAIEGATIRREYNNYDVSIATLPRIWRKVGDVLYSQPKGYNTTYIRMANGDWYSITIR